MKYFVVIFSLLIFNACSVLPSVPDNHDPKDWFDFGKERAMSGWYKKSKSFYGLNSEIYSFYSDGYEEGLNVYCSQNAFMLGVREQPYNGICDRLKPEFRMNYLNGVKSTTY